MEKHTFTAAVRGYHFYWRVWQPKKNEKLICLHEPGNAFDRFAIKTTSENWETVGHLPKEISRITKYFLDRGASLYCKLSSEHFRRSPLVQGGLEIECQAVIETRATILQAKLTSRYLDLVKDLYTEPTEDSGWKSVQFRHDVAAYSRYTASPRKKEEKVCIHKLYCFKKSGNPRNASGIAVDVD